MHAVAAAGAGGGLNASRLWADGAAAQRGDRDAQQRLFAIFSRRCRPRPIVLRLRPRSQVRPGRRPGVRRAGRFRRARAPGRGRSASSGLADSPGPSGGFSPNSVARACREPLMSGSFTGRRLVNSSRVVVRRPGVFCLGRAPPALPLVRCCFCWPTRKERKAMLGNLLRRGGRTRDSVVGSGSTVACVRLSRRCNLFELDRASRGAIWGRYGGCRDGRR